MLIDELQGRESDDDEDGDEDGDLSRDQSVGGSVLPHGQDFEYFAANGPPSGAPTVSGAGTFGTDTVTTPGSGLVFVNTYGAGVTTAFHTAIVQAETYLESHFTNAITIHANFDLQALNHAFSGQNSFGGVGATYQQIVSALQAHATTPADAAAVAKLQGMADPSGGQLFFVPNAQAKMLGLPGTSNGTDDTIILNSFYWNDTSINANMGDAVGVLMHELTEGGMGRIGGQWAMMDLFRYTAQGQLDDTGGQDGKPTYFSVNGQNINTGLQFHSPVNAQGTDDGFDWADWDQVGTNGNAHDPFGPGGPGAGDPGTLSATDLQIIDVLGWTPPSPNGIAVTATSGMAVQGGAAVALLTGPPTITDTTSTTIASATVKVGTSGGSIFIGDELFLNGQQSGTVSGVTISWNDSTKVMTLTGTASLATYQTLLGQVSYEFLGTDGTSNHTQHTVTWTVNDGTQNLSTTSLIAIDHAPVAANDAGGGAAGVTTNVAAANGVLANDVDQDHDLLTVSAVNGQAANVGHAVFSSIGQLTLNQDGSYSYAANAGAAGGSTDTFTYTATDGHGGTSSATLTITLENPPSLTGLVNAAFTEKQAAVTLSPSVTVADPDNTTLASATVKISGGTFAGDGDVLATSTAGTAISASYNSATETLVLSGNDTLADYQTVLDKVTFSSSSKNPTNFGSASARTITWIVNDGIASSAVMTILNITPVNDAPTVASAATVVSTNTGQPLTVSPSLTLADPDSLGLASATVKVTGGTFAGDGDVLSATTTGTAISANYNSATETLILSGNDTLAHYQSVLDGVVFQTTPTAGVANQQSTRTLSWSVNDGSSQSAIATTTIAVEPVKTDFNDDLHADILFQDTGNDALAGTPQVWMMNGTSVVSQTMLSNPGSNWVIAGTGDFNHDGKADIVLRDTVTGTIQVREMNGSSVLVSANIGTVPTNLTLAAVADFNGDGSADLLWRDNAGNLAMWTMNGLGFSAAAGIGNVPTNWTIAGTGDFNGDGKADILWRDNNGLVAMWEMNGMSFIAAGAIGNVPATWKASGGGDFDGDGKADILWQDTVGGGAALWIMDGMRFTTAAGVGNPGPGWSAMGAGDYNGDGKADILFQNTNGTPQIWTMDGTSVTGTATLANPGQNWHATTT